MNNIPVEYVALGLVVFQTLFMNYLFMYLFIYDIIFDRISYYP